jgi:GT2 family glycosyltransferase
LPAPLRGNLLKSAVPLITVAICTRNRVALLARAVTSVQAQLNDRAELLIVDNGSTDATAATIKNIIAIDPRVKYLLESRTGLSHARNLALQSARGEWVIFLDDDATVQPGWLAAYEAFFSKLPAPQITVAGGPVIPDYETPPPGWLRPSAASFHDVTATRSCAPTEHPWGCNYAVRRETALAAGGFNIALGHCGQALGAYEEIELTERLRRAGGAVWLVADARIKHLVAAERLRLGWQSRCAFGQGRSRARNRLAARKNRGERIKFIAGRTLLAPFHAGINVLVALVAWPVHGGRHAASAWLRACSIAGLTCELLKHQPGKNCAHD